MQNYIQSCIPVKVIVVSPLVPQVVYYNSRYTQNLCARILVIQINFGSWNTQKLSLKIHSNCISRHSLTWAFNLFLLHNSSCLVQDILQEHSSSFPRAHAPDPPELDMP